MTVTATGPRVGYATDGVTKTWSFPFSVSSPSDVKLRVINVAGTMTVVPPSQYSVTVNPPVAPNPTSVGGTLTFPLAGFAAGPGAFVEISRQAPAEQDTSLTNQSIIYPPVVEQEFDYLTMIDQQLVDGLSRTIQLSPLDSPMPPLPPAAQRANQQAVFDANGNMTAGGAIIGTVISGAMIPVVTAPDLISARAAMGVPSIVSPAFTGNPTSTTPPPLDNDTSIATTEWVQNFVSINGGGFPSGTRILFQQSTAPAGWTKDLFYHDRALRVVNGTVGFGGTLGFSSVFGLTSTGPFTLTTNEMPNHAHGVNDPSHSHTFGDSGHFHDVSGADGSPIYTTGPGSGLAAGATASSQTQQGRTNIVGTGASILANFTGITTIAAGNSQPHVHPMDIRTLYVDAIICQRD